MSEGFESGTVPTPDKTSGSVVVKCMHPVFESKTSPVIAPPMTNSVGRHKIVKSRDRDALTVVGGVMDDECGVGRVMWYYH